MNTAPCISKDGVSDADLMRAARDMYEALVEIEGLPAEREDEAHLIALNALAKARGEGRS